MTKTATSAYISGLYFKLHKNPQHPQIVI